MKTKSAFCGVMVTALVYVGAFVPDQAVAQVNPTAGELTLTNEKVIVFKDGFCLVVKKAVGKTNEQGIVYTDQVPDEAVLGSFWAIPKQNTLKSMTVGWVDEEAISEMDVPCLGTIDILQANLGETCRFTVNEGTKLSGTILKILATSRMVIESADTESLIAASSNVVRTSPNAKPAAVRYIDSPVATQFILRTTQGDVLVNAADVRQLYIDGMRSTLPRRVTERSRSKLAKYQFESPNSNVEMLIIYFRPGIRWIPTYRINLHSNAADEPTASQRFPKTAEIALQCELLNEAEDLVDVPIDIVVGVPNFRFREVASPLTLESTLRNALAKAAPQLMAQFGNNGQVNLSNSMLSQRVSERRGEQVPDPNVGNNEIDLPTDLTAGGGNDLFVYHLPKMSLAKGERTAVPIFTTQAKYRDVYTWDTSITHTESITPASAGSPLVLSENRIWRQIELTNETQFPWTTGAAMIVDDLQPLGQELLTYTPPGTVGRMPVTVAVDVRGQIDDRELNRRIGDLQFNGYNYSLVFGQVGMKILNHKEEPIELEVSLRFGGKATKATEEGTIVLSPFHAEDWKDYRSDPSVNNSSRIIWKHRLESKKTFVPTVDYEFLSRN